MRILYTFQKLSETSKMKVCYDYAMGWKETHEDEDLSYQEIFEILKNSDDLYDYSGELVGSPFGVGI